MSIVWASQLDNRYNCTVERMTNYSGRLTVFDAQDNKILLEEYVDLSYGAMFGPDVADVALWENKIIALIDGETSGE